MYKILGFEINYKYREKEISVIFQDKKSHLNYKLLIPKRIKTHSNILSWLSEELNCANNDIEIPSHLKFPDLS